MRVLSLGAGVQSSTLALMIAKGEVPMVDCAIFADTQAEPKHVYGWLDFLEKQLPFPVYRVTKGNLREAVLDAAKLRVRVSNPPFYTDTGILGRSCTQDYKLAPIKRKIRELVGRGTAEVLLGISWDEAIRMKPSRVKYITHSFPLIEKEMTRGHCLEWMEDNGYPLPPKSACTFCPYHDDSMWRELKTHDPESFSDAVVVDAAIRKGIYNTTQNLFLHRSLKPLDQVDFDSAEDKGQGRLFSNECEGMCGV
jgi:hypothetical protein